MSPAVELSWRAIAAAKRKSIYSLIPDEWQLPSPISPAEYQRDVTGEYIHRFLSLREIEITETSATDIVQQTTTGKWRATEVAEAFCHRAAIAHQLVSMASSIVANFNR